MKSIFLILLTMALSAFYFEPQSSSGTKNSTEFNFFVDQFADLRILRYEVDDFELLNEKQKLLIYYLSQAAVCGRDIIYDQNGQYNLKIRRTLENIYKTYSGNRNSEEFKNFEVYLKRVWFSNGIYHHYSSDKLVPDFPKEYFNELVKHSDLKRFPGYKGH
ncbi:MAG: hypothetical protein HC906_10940 [Bacteroidales bacterium]|nr:hypothetical protein [Bacteroidales bacterium]